MADVFKTQKGQPDVEIPGAGIVTETGGVTVERVAQVAHELQDQNGKPLTGQKLASAAKDWAERVGLSVGRGSEPDDTAPVGATTTAPEQAQEKE